MTKAILVAQFLRARAWWRLDSAGASALHVARSVVSLLDAAAYLRDLPDDHPDMMALEAAGCFGAGVFDPGPEGADIVREWQLADTRSAGPSDLLAELVRAASAASAAARAAARAAASAASAASAAQARPATSVPRQRASHRLTPRSWTSRS